MNPIQKALAQADKITDAQNALEALSRQGRLVIIDTRTPAKEKIVSRRSYVIGLPVVIHVDDDGYVSAEVDLSEAYDAPHESPEFYDAEDNLVEVPEDTRIADSERISTAVERDTVVVH